MISMTGFGRGEFSVGARAYRVELRSVNNRFLDVKVRLPWTDVELEGRALALIRGRLTRGRVEVSAFEERGGRSGAGIRLDVEVARDVAAAVQQLAGVLGSDLATAARLLPQVKELLGGEVVAGAEELWAGLERGLAAALDGLGEMRRREGQALAADLASHLDQVAARVEAIRGLAVGEAERQRDRLRERLARLRGEEPVDEARLAEEVVVFADRCDVSEELARLGSHLQQLRGMLAVSGEVGRRFEFMLQEAHRELNTIASKTLTAEIAHLVVEAKASVERMREQVQNVE